MVKYLSSESGGPDHRSGNFLQDPFAYFKVFPQNEHTKSYISKFLDSSILAAHN